MLVQFIVIVVVCVIIVGISVVIGSRLYDKRVENGEIKPRSLQFMQDAVEFTLRPVKPQKIIDVLKKIEYEKYGMGMQGNSAHQDFKFNGDKWKARLFLKETAANRSTYRFEFIDWKDNNGMPWDMMNMNRLATIIENMFQSFDSNVRIEVKPVTRAPKKKKLF